MDDFKIPVLLYSPSLVPRPWNDCGVFNPNIWLAILVLNKLQASAQTALKHIVIIAPLIMHIMWSLQEKRVIKYKRERASKSSHGEILEDPTGP